jgi:hypothetical protein
MKKLLFFSAAVFLFAACETGDEDRIAQAQACLDRANQTTVSECELIVAGVTGPRASLIRCSADFIAQGFTGSRFASAFTALKTTTTGQNSTLAMMAYLVFTVGADDAARNAAADTAVNNCTSSGLPGMIMFSQFAKSATLISAGLAITPGTPPTPAQMQGNLGAVTGANVTSLGTSIIAISTIYCAPTSSTKDVTFCASVNNAASQGGANAVGTQMLALLGVVP